MNTVHIGCIFSNNIILFRLNTALILKVKIVSVFLLAKVAVIRLNAKKIELKIYSCN